MGTFLILVEGCTVSADVGTFLILVEIGSSIDSFGTLTHWPSIVMSGTALSSSSRRTPTITLAAEDAGDHLAVAGGQHD